MTLRLPMLEPHDAALQTCVYCPKLCRAACPVSNVEASETVIPWGKMSMAYFAARGDVPIDTHHASTAWACTNCHACTERCDPRNDVATVLTDARADFFARGVAPEGASRVSQAWHEAREASASAVRAVAERAGATADAKTAVLLGCGYAKHAPEIAEQALRAVSQLTGGPVRAVESCCGLPLLDAGDRAGFSAAAERLASEIVGAQTIVAVDPGCARTVIVEYPRASVEAPKVTLFVDLVHDKLGRLGPIGGGPVRYHDPCQLGRGLGRFDEPRAILRKITGETPLEMPRHHALGACSGAGGLLPATRPETSRAIADERIAEHRAAGGGTLVTACAASLRRFRSRGEPAEDLVSLVARAIVD